MSDIRSCIVSRFNEGKLVEADYSQIEIATLANLSEDKKLISDLTSGVDIHLENAAAMFHRGDTTKVSAWQRRIAKQLSFQLQYGAGAKSMAESNKIPLSVAKKFIQIYRERYPGVIEWQDQNLNAVEMTKKLLPDEKTERGYPRNKNTLVDGTTGRIYTFKSYDAPKWLRDRGVDTTFSPSQIKNYPVQGRATGDIVPIAVARVFWELWPQHEVMVPIITVHDSLVYDCFDTAISRKCIETMQRVMEDEVQGYLEQKYDMKFHVPLKVDFKTGENWGEMVDFE